MDWEMSVALQLNVRALATTPDNFAGEQIKQLEKQRADILKSKPNLHATSGLRMGTGAVAAFVGGSVTMMGVATALEHTAWYRAFPAYTNPEFKLMGYGMLAALPIMAGAFLLGTHAGDSIFGVKGAARDKVIAQHDASVHERVSVLDRQIAALKN